MENYISFDEFSATHASLIILENCVNSLRVNDAFYKGAIEQAYNAVAGACVCILTTTAGIGANKSTVEKKMLSYLEQGSRKAMAKANGDQFKEEPLPYPEHYQLNPREMLAKLPIGLAITVLNEPKPTETVEQIRLRDLIFLRESFVHFPSRHHSIQKAMIINALQGAIKKVSNIASSDGYQQFNRFHGTDVCALCERLIAQLADISASHNSA